MSRERFDASPGGVSILKSLVSRLAVSALSPTYIERSLDKMQPRISISNAQNAYLRLRITEDPLFLVEEIVLISALARDFSGGKADQPRREVRRY